MSYTEFSYLLLQSNDYWSCSADTTVGCRSWLRPVGNIVGGVDLVGGWSRSPCMR